MYAVDELKAIRNSFSKRFHTTLAHDQAKVVACEIDASDGVRELLHEIATELCPTKALSDFEEMMIHMRQPLMQIAVMALGGAAIIAVIENAFDILIDSLV